MKKHPISELVLDFGLYPRGSVDTHHVTEIVCAINAGALMPPVVIDKKSKRVVDGFHRIRGYLRVYNETHVIDCIEKAYDSEKEFFLDAMRFNASHGRALTTYDKSHCLLLAERLQIPLNLVQEALHLTAGRVGELQARAIGKLAGQPVAIKQTIRHMAGRQLTQAQANANEKLSGMNQLFYANQLITLIENDLLDTDNADLMAGLEKLRALLDDVLKQRAA